MKTRCLVFSELTMPTVFTRKNNGFPPLYDRKLTQSYGLTCPDKYRSQSASCVVTDAFQTIWQNCFPDARGSFETKPCEHGWRISKHVTILSPLYNSFGSVGCSDSSSMALPCSPRRHAESIPELRATSSSYVCQDYSILSPPSHHQCRDIDGILWTKLLLFRKNIATISTSELSKSASCLAIFERWRVCTLNLLSY